MTATREAFQSLWLTVLRATFVAAAAAAAVMVIVVAVVAPAVAAAEPAVASPLHLLNNHTRLCLLSGVAALARLSLLFLLLFQLLPPDLKSVDATIRRLVVLAKKTWRIALKELAEEQPKTGGQYHSMPSLHQLRPHQLLFRRLARLPPMPSRGHAVALLFFFFSMVQSRRSACSGKE